MSPTAPSWSSAWCRPTSCRSIGLLAAGVAHEVNTPLAVISTYAQMLAKQVADDDAEIPDPRQDRQADLPRQRNRQFAAEFLAHLHHLFGDVKLNG